MENIEIVFPGGGDEHYAHVGLDELDKVPEMPKAYPEFSQHMELPAWGFFVRHVDGLVMSNIKLPCAAASTSGVVPSTLRCSIDEWCRA